MTPRSAPSRRQLKPRRPPQPRQSPQPPQARGRCTRYGALHPLRGGAPVTWRCTRTEEVHCLRIGCSTSTNKNKRGTGTTNHSPPHPSMRSWALPVAGRARRPRHHLHSCPLRHLPHPYMRRARKPRPRHNEAGVHCALTASARTNLASDAIAITVKVRTVARLTTMQRRSSRSPGLRTVAERTTTRGATSIRWHRIQAPPGTRIVEPVTLRPDPLRPRGHDAGAIEVEPRSTQIQPAGRHSARRIKVVPRSANRAPSRHHCTGGSHVIPGTPLAHPTRRHRASTQVVPGATNLRPAARHHARISEVIPGTTDHVPPRRHHAGRSHVVPGTPLAHPARCHCAGSAKEIPASIDPLPARTHESAGRIEVVPRALHLGPAAHLHARGRVILPRTAGAIPSGNHVATSIEAIGRTINDAHLTARVAAVIQVVPPAGTVLLPTGLGSGRRVRLRVRLGIRLRIGLRIGLRVRLGIRLRIGLRIRLRVRLGIGLRVGRGLCCGRRFRIDDRIQIGSIGGHNNARKNSRRSERRNHASTHVRGTHVCSSR